MFPLPSICFFNSLSIQTLVRFPMAVFLQRILFSALIPSLLLPSHFLPLSLSSSRPILYHFHLLISFSAQNTKIASKRFGSFAACLAPSWEKFGVFFCSSLSLPQQFTNRLNQALQLRCAMIKKRCLAGCWLPLRRCCFAKLWILLIQPEIYFHQANFRLDFCHAFYPTAKTIRSIPLRPVKHNDRSRFPFLPL